MAEVSRTARGAGFARLPWLAAAIGLVFAIAAVGLIAPRRRARELLGKTASVHFSRSTPADLARIFGKPSQVEGNDCDRQTCHEVWIVNNRVLAALHLAPRTALNVGALVMDGTAQAIWVSLASQESSGALRGAMLTLETEPDLVPNQPVPESGGVPKYVTLSANVRLEQVANFPIDAKCLTRLGGCRDAADVLPWVQWPKG